LLSEQCTVEKNSKYKNFSTWRDHPGKTIGFLYFKNLETQVSAVMPRKNPLFLKTQINAVASIQRKPLLAVAIVSWAILN
jgi:hypothetical protein